MGEQPPLDVLKAARELIAEPSRWTKGAHARAADGEATERFGRSLGRPPVCFCAAGAICRVIGYDAWLCSYEELPFEALNQTLDADGIGGNFVDFNDAPERTHAEVLDLFDRTIARLEAEAAHD